MVGMPGTRYVFVNPPPDSTAHVLVARALEHDADRSTISLIPGDGVPKATWSFAQRSGS
jgi:hypothetical protein